MNMFMTTMRHTVLCALCLWCWAGMASSICAQDEPEIPEELKPKSRAPSSSKKSVPESSEGPEEVEDPDGVMRRPAQKVSRAVINQRMRDYVQSSATKVTIHQVVQEMIDDFIADTRDLRIAAVSPLAVRNVGLSPNLAKPFGDWVESELINALAKHTDIRVKRCIACKALKTRVDKDDWVVSLGHTTQQDLADEAKRIGVVAYADAFVSWIPGANTVSLNVQIYRAVDSKILWTETYQSDATTAAILRSGDRILTRDEAREELVRKIDQRPYYGYQLFGGAGVIPYEPPSTAPTQDGSAPNRSITGVLIGGRIYEKWGEDLRFLYGFHGEAFVNVSEENPLLGAFLGATTLYQLNEPNLNQPIYRAGGTVQGFIAGSEGNSFALEANFEVILQFRFGLSVGAFYFFPTDFAEGILGGPGAKARIVFNW